jgi:hypothetical protein
VEQAAVTRRLDDDPIYVAATQRAACMTRDEADFIALRSSDKFHCTKYDVDSEAPFVLTAIW